MRVPATMTPSAGLLWALAFVLAGALAYWDYSQSTSERAAGPATRGPDLQSDVEIEVVYDPQRPQDDSGRGAQPR